MMVHHQQEDSQQQQHQDEEEEEQVIIMQKQQQQPLFFPRKEATTNMKMMTPCASLGFSCQTATTTTRNTNMTTRRITTATTSTAEDHTTNRRMPRIARGGGGVVHEEDDEMVAESSAYHSRSRLCRYSMTMIRRRTRRIGSSRNSNSIFMTTMMIIIMMMTMFQQMIPRTFGLKHNFKTKYTTSPIGPVGVPFGFLEGGHYQLTVFNFGVSMLKKQHNNKKLIDQETVYRNMEPGFLLKKFNNEASFHQHMELLKSNTSLCTFQVDSPSDDDVLADDDMAYGLNDDDDNEQPMMDDLMKKDAIISSMETIESAKDGILLSMKSSSQTWKPNTPTIEYTFKSGEEGLYFLIYQVCTTPGTDYNTIIRSSFELDFHFKNIDSFGHDSFLSAGEASLPTIFFFFAISYLVCLIVWLLNIREIQNGRKSTGYLDKSKIGAASSLSSSTSNGKGKAPTTTTPSSSSSSSSSVFAIHHLMSMLILVKFLSIFFESVRYYFIRLSGHAELWSIVYYMFTFIKGTFLFTVILLIGTGWSFIKPFLNDREKKIIFIILLLQVINNIALIFLSQETEGETSYGRWTTILHLVDIICCCLVLIPLVWSVNMLEKSTTTEEDDEDDQEHVDEDESEYGGQYGQRRKEQQHDDGEKEQILTKLKLFRSFYLLVVAYIYFTRILVYIFATMLDYKHIWVRYFIVELVTLTFYVIVGFMFQPMIENGNYNNSSGNETDGLLRQHVANNNGKSTTTTHYEVELSSGKGK